MRFAHARPATVTLVAGSVLITATSGFSLAAVMGATSAWAHPSSYAIAADDAATTAGDQSCQPLKATDPPPTSSPTPTPTPTATHTSTSTSSTPTPTPTATTTDPPATASTTPTRRDPVGQRDHERQSGKHARPRRRRRQCQADKRAKLLLDVEQIAEAHRVAVSQYLQDARHVREAQHRQDFHCAREARRVSHAELLAVPCCLLHPQLLPDARRVFHAELLPVGYRVCVPYLVSDSQHVTVADTGQDDEVDQHDEGTAHFGQAGGEGNAEGRGHAG